MEFDGRQSGSNFRKDGLLLVPDWNGKHPNSSPKRHVKIKEKDIEKWIERGLMTPYFAQALATRNDKPIPLPGSPGIPHDYDTQNEVYKPDAASPNFDPDVWLPGVFLIDEIFKALLSEIGRRIRAVNAALVQVEQLIRSDGSAFPTAEKKKALELAESTKKNAVGNLDEFVKAFSTNDRDHTEAGPYLKFINFILPDKAKSPEELTFIKLVKSDEYVLGALVHVGDWAGGSHSSGSAVH